MWQRYHREQDAEGIEAVENGRVTWWVFLWV